MGEALEAQIEQWDNDREESKIKRARNRIRGRNILKLKEIPFEERNDGAHLIVMDRFDYWPGTGKWVERGTAKHHRGIKSLLKRIKECQEDKKDGND